jgi:hypothetical protein
MLIGSGIMLYLRRQSDQAASPLIQPAITKA